MSAEFAKENSLGVGFANSEAGVVRHAVLQDGKEYPLHGGDAVFKCLWHSEMGDYALVERLSPTAPWRCYIHDITLYPDGSISWAYGGGGAFVDGDQMG